MTSNKQSSRHQPMFSLPHEEIDSSEHVQLLDGIEEAARIIVGSNSNTQRGSSLIFRSRDQSIIRHDHQHSKPIMGDLYCGSSSPLTNSTNISAVHQPILGVKGDEFFEPSSPFDRETGMVNIRRPVYSQNAFSRLFEENELDTKKSTSSHGCCDCFMENCTSGGPGTAFEKFTRILFLIFPFLSMIRQYKVRHYLLPDIISGLTTGIMRIPQSMAYALLARLEPVFGLYTAFFSALLYFVFGGSNHMAAGAQGILSLMIGSGVDRVLQSNPSLNITSPNASDPSADIDPRVIDIAVTISFLVGVTQLGIGTLRLGFVTNYLSDPLIGGFTTGAACHVVVSQLPSMLGISIPNIAGNFNLPLSVIAIFRRIVQVNFATLIISFFCLVILFLIKFINDRYRTKLKFPIPGELVIMIGAILFSNFTKAHDIWNVTVVGEVPSGFLLPRLPTPEYMPSCMSIAISAAIVSYAIGYSISKRLSLLYDYDIFGNQEAFAFGFMNTISSFFNCFSATASMSASSLHETLGGKSQIANLIASLLVLFTLLYLGFLFDQAPKAVLSVIIIVNLKSILSQFKDLKVLWGVSRIDFLLWLVSWLGVVILDVDTGLFIGVATSLITVVFRTQWPYVCILGRIPSTDIYKNRSLTPNAFEIPGIVIYRFEGSLYFASAEHFKNTLYSLSDCNPVKLFRHKIELAQKLSIVKEHVQNTLIRNDSTLTSAHTSTTNVGAGEQGNRLWDLEKSNIHHVILDFSVCAFIDSVGIRALAQVVEDYQSIDIFVYLANVRASVRSMILNSTWLKQQQISCKNSFGSRNIYVSVHDAVLAALEQAQKTEEREFLMMDAATGLHALQVTRQASFYASDADVQQSFIDEPLRI